MTEVYFGGDGCPTCGRAIREPWSRPHAEWCAQMRRREPGSLGDAGQTYGAAYREAHPPRRERLAA